MVEKAVLEYFMFKDRVTCLMIGFNDIIMLSDETEYSSDNEQENNSHDLLFQRYKKQADQSKPIPKSQLYVALAYFSGLGVNIDLSLTLKYIHSFNKWLNIDEKFIIDLIVSNEGKIKKMSSVKQIIEFIRVNLINKLKVESEILSESNNENVIFLYEAMAKLGDLESMSIASVLYTENLWKDLDKALYYANEAAKYDFFRPLFLYHLYLAEQDDQHPQSMIYVSLDYLHGRGTLKDFNLHATFLKKYCDILDFSFDLFVDYINKYDDDLSKCSSISGMIAVLLGYLPTDKNLISYVSNISSVEDSIKILTQFAMDDNIEAIVELIKKYEERGKITDKFLIEFWKRKAEILVTTTEFDTVDSPSCSVLFQYENQDQNHQGDYSYKVNPDRKQSDPHACEEGLQILNLKMSVS